MKPKHITPKELKAHLDAGPLKVKFEKDWDKDSVNPYGTSFKPISVLLHHTAGTNSLAFMMKGSYPPVRNAQFLVDRDGTIHCIANSAYHAGKGEWEFPGFTVPKDDGNRFMYGIEIESLGTSDSVTDGSKDKDGMTAVQVTASAQLTAELCKLMGVDTEYVIRHKDYAGPRKVDVKQSLKYWRKRVDEFMSNQWDGKVPDIEGIYAAESNSSLKNPASWRLACRLKDLGHFSGDPVKGEQGYPRRAVESFNANTQMSEKGAWGPRAHEKVFMLPKGSVE